MGADLVLCKVAKIKTLPATHKNGYLQGSATASRKSQPMNSTNEMSHEDVLRVKLEVLRQEHRDLDEAIHAMQELRRADQLTIRRLKAKKLQLKDQIAKIEDDLTPDIIA